MSLDDQKDSKFDTQIYRIAPVATLDVAFCCGDFACWHFARNPIIQGAGWYSQNTIIRLIRLLISKIDLIWSRNDF